MWNYAEQLISTDHVDLELLSRKNGSMHFIEMWFMSVEMYFLLKLSLKTGKLRGQGSGLEGLFIAVRIPPLSSFHSETK